jgi:uncharacterized membrane protein
MADETCLDKFVKAVAATVIILVFLGAAYCLYQRNFDVRAADSAYLLKVADTFINAAIVGVFLAMLRAWFGLPKVVAAVRNWFQTAPTTSRQ